MICEHCGEEIQGITTNVWPWVHKTGYMTGRPECSAHATCMATPVEPGKAEVLYASDILEKIRRDR